MDILIVLFMIAAVVANAKKKQRQQKQKEEETRRRAWQAMQAEQAAAPQRAQAPQPVQMRMQPRVRPQEQAGPRPMQTKMNTAPVWTPVEGSIAYDSPEGEDDAGNAYKIAAQSVRETAPHAQHVVRPATESGHAHVESSITGIQPQEECESDPIAAPAAQAAPAVPALRLDQNAARQAVIYAEILGRPRAKQRLHG